MEQAVWITRFSEQKVPHHSRKSIFELRKTTLGRENRMEANGCAKHFL